MSGAGVDLMLGGHHSKSGADDFLDVAKVSVDSTCSMADSDSSDGQTIDSDDEAVPPPPTSTARLWGSSDGQRRASKPAASASSPPTTATATPSPVQTIAAADDCPRVPPPEPPRTDKPRSAEEGVEAEDSGIADIDRTPPSSVQPEAVVRSQRSGDDDEDGAYLYIAATSSTDQKPTSAPNPRTDSTDSSAVDANRHDSIDEGGQMAEMDALRSRALARQQAMEEHSVAASALHTFTGAVETRVKEEHAATVIQSSYRGHAVRKRSVDLANEAHESRLAETEEMGAATSASEDQADCRIHAARQQLEAQQDTESDNESGDEALCDNVVEPAHAYAKLVEAVATYNDALPESAECNEPLGRLAKSVPRAVLQFAPDGSEPVAVVAIQQQKCNALATLLYCGVSSGCTSRDGSPLLLVAVSSNAPSRDIIDLLCSVCSVDIDTPGPTGCTALLRACKLGHVEVVQDLLARGADAQCVDAAGSGCLQHAKDHPAVVVVLQPRPVRDDADTAPSTEEGSEANREVVWTKLITAVTASDDSQSKDAECNLAVSALIASLPPTAIDWAPDTKERVVVAAVQLQKFGAATALLNGGASVHATSTGGQSLLALCARATPLPLDLMGQLCGLGLRTSDPFDSELTVADAVERRSDVAAIASESPKNNAFLAEMHATVWAEVPAPPPVLSAPCPLTLEERVALRIAAANAAMGLADPDDLESESAATSIQAAYRGHVARKELGHQRVAATTIQSQFRGYAARKRSAALASEIQPAAEIESTTDAASAAEVAPGDANPCTDEVESGGQSQPNALDVVLQHAAGNTAESTTDDISDALSAETSPQGSVTASTPRARFKLPGPPPPPPAETTSTASIAAASTPRTKAKVGFADDVVVIETCALEIADTAAASADFVDDTVNDVVSAQFPPPSSSSTAPVSSDHAEANRAIESAASAAAFGHYDEGTIALFRAGVFTSDRMSDAIRIQILELRLVMSFLFRDKKQIFPVAIKIPFQGESRVSTGERADCLGAYTKSKQPEDTTIIFVTRVSKIDKASYVQSKDDVILLSNAALFVITAVKPRVKYRISYRDIGSISLSSFYDGVFVIHAGDTRAKDFGDRIYNAADGVHAMELAANIVRAARISGRETLGVQCSAEIQHVIKGKKLGRIRFKLFGKVGLDVIKDKAGKVLQVTAPKVNAIVVEDTDDGTTNAGYASPSKNQSQAFPPRSVVTEGNAKNWHEMD